MGAKNKERGISNSGISGLKFPKVITTAVMKQIKKIALPIKIFSAVVKVLKFQLEWEYIISTGLFVDWLNYNQG